MGKVDFRIHQGTSQCYTAGSESFEEVKRRLKSLQPEPVEKASVAYNDASNVLARMSNRLIDHGKTLVDNWSGKEAQKAVKQLQQVHWTTTELSNKSHKVAHSYHWYSSEILTWYKNVGDTMSDGMFTTGGDHEFARKYLSKLYMRTGEAQMIIPTSITKDLPGDRWEEKPPIGPGGGPPGGPGGLPTGGPPGGPNSPFGPNGPGGPNIPNGPGSPDYPGGPNGPGSPNYPGGPNGPGSPNYPGSPNGPGSPNYPGGPNSPFGPNGPGGGGTDLSNLPGGGGGGLPGGGGGLPGGGLPGGGPGGLGAGGLGPGAGGMGPGGAGMGPGAFGPAGLGAAGRNGMGGMPMAPGAGGGKDGEKERERTTWLTEDEDVWGADGDTAPPVIG